MTGLAVISGAGDLPRLIASDRLSNDRPTLIVDFEGIEVDWADDFERFTARFEQPEKLFEHLRQFGCTQVVMAGAMERPKLDIARFDTTFAGIAPRLMVALQQGDDAALRVVLEMFEIAGFEIVPAQALLGDLLLGEGCPTVAQPSDYDLTDIKQAKTILSKTSELDIGQGVVVAGGLCLGIETLQGTQALLGFAGQTNPSLKPMRGTFVKAPKEGQETRVDVPSIGVDTMDQLASARLSGVAIPAGAVLVIDRDAVIARADQLGLFILSYV